MATKTIRATKSAGGIRVMHFGLGAVGTAIVRQVASRPGCKVVGGIDSDPAAVGRDLGDVAGLPRRLNVKVAGDAAKGMCCNFQEAARERLVESAGLRFMPPPRTGS